MTEDEFWRSTLAKVQALYEVKRLRWDKSRDYLLSQIISFQANRYTRTKESDRVWLPDDFLGIVYPDSAQKGSNTVTVTQDRDLDMGAGGDWRELKSALKGTTEKAKSMKAKLKPFNPLKPPIPTPRIKLDAQGVDLQQGKGKVTISTKE
jgi:hypothetical protein